MHLYSGLSFPHPLSASIVIYPLILLWVEKFTRTDPPRTLNGTVSKNQDRLGSTSTIFFTNHGWKVYIKISLLILVSTNSGLNSIRYLHLSDCSSNTCHHVCLDRTTLHLEMISRCLEGILIDFIILNAMATDLDYMGFSCLKISASGPMM